MRQISDRYASIFQDFYADKAQSRFDYVIRYSSEFLAALPFADKVDCHVDKLGVDGFVTSYFLDVIKFKEYHFYSNGALRTDKDSENEQVSAQGDANKRIHRGKMLNASKVGAFTLKWMLKYRPVAILPKDGQKLDVFERRHIQNTPFLLALNISLRAMGIEPHEMPEELYRSLLYHVRYRQYNDRDMIMYFELLVSHIDLLQQKKYGS